MATGDGEEEKSAGDSSPEESGQPAGDAKAGVMGLGEGDDVVDVGLSGTCEVPAGMGPVDPPSHGRHDAGLERLLWIAWRWLARPRIGSLFRT